MSIKQFQKSLLFKIITQKDNFFFFSLQIIHNKTVQTFKYTSSLCKELKVDLYLYQITLKGRQSSRRHYYVYFLGLCKIGSNCAYFYTFLGTGTNQLVQAFLLVEIFTINER